MTFYYSQESSKSPKLLWVAGLWLSLRQAVQLPEFPEPGLLWEAASPV